MTLNEKTQLSLREYGVLAKQLKNNPLLWEVIDSLVREIHESWESEPSSQRREELWHAQRAATNLKDELIGRISKYCSAATE